MPRQVRIEYPGAIYHVMARGDRKEAIVRDDADRQTFVRTLGEAAQRAGFRVHAWVLMRNHYHLLLETPEANLSRGMAWLQNAFTRRINTRHQLWGHLFGGRYKAIVAEPGNCFWALLDYVHLNPVRAGLVERSEGLESYRWSSLHGYLQKPEARPPWLETGTGFQVAGCADTASGRKDFLRLLEERVDWGRPRSAGARFRAGKSEPQLAVRTALRRGWFFGCQTFRESLLERIGKKFGAGRNKREDGYSGPEVRKHDEHRAEKIVLAGLTLFAIGDADLRRLACNDWRKRLLAEVAQSETTVRLDWIRKRLEMGDRSYCCRLIRSTRERLPSEPKWRNTRLRILKMSINHD